MSLQYVTNRGELDRGVFAPFYGQFVEDKLRTKFTRGPQFPDFGLPDEDFVEFSVYSEEGDLLHWSRKFDLRLNVEGVALLDVQKHVLEAELPDDPNLTVRYNFHRKALGGPVGFKLFVQEISPSRREVRVLPIKFGDDALDQSFNAQYEGFFDGGIGQREFDFVCNFGNNVIHHLINWQESVDDAYVLRLFEPLPESVTVGDEFWINREIGRPYFDRFSLLRSRDTQQGQFLRGPNFQVSIAGEDSPDTEYSNFESLVGSDFSTTQDLVNKIISGGERIDLNVDWESFDEFINFSSAQERVLNFQYKLRVLQKLQNELEVATGADPAQVQKKRQQISDTIGSFDDYESYLYESAYPRTDEDKLAPLDSFAGTEFIDELVEEAKQFDSKNNSSLRNLIPVYIKEDPDNEEFVLFVDMIAHYFDLIWLYVKHLQYKSDRSEDASSPESLSKELSQFVAKSFGFELYNGFDTEELFELLFTEKQSEIYEVFDSGQFSVLGTGEEKSAEQAESKLEVQRQIWRRMLNNLPLILKGKGTARSIRAILASYGIPQSSLTIREFGGTSINHKETVYEIEDDTHRLPFFGNQHVRIPWDSGQTVVPTPQTYEELISGFRDYGKSVEVRFRTEFRANNPIKLLELQDTVSVTLEKSEKGLPWGRLKLTVKNPDGTLVEAETIEEVPLFDGKESNVLLSLSEDQPAIDLTYQRSSPFGNVIHEAVASVAIDLNGAFKFLQANDLYVGGRVDGGTRFSGPLGLFGDLDFIKIWRNPLPKEQFDEHTLAPLKYDWNNRFLADEGLIGNEPLGVINEQLLFDLDFSLPQDLSTDPELMNESPNTDVYDEGRPAEAFGFSAENGPSFNFERYERKSFLPTVKVGANALHNQKIRIEKTNLVGSLSSNRSVEVGSLDEISKDSPRLGIYFSPQEGINRDIIASIGIDNLNGLLGDPRDQRRDRYPLLEQLNTRYWSKYSKPVNFEQFFRYIQEFNRALFTQVRKLVPARSRLYDGLLVEPHVLERSRERNVISEVENATKQTTLEANPIEPSAQLFREETEVNVTENVQPSAAYPSFRTSTRLDLERRFAGNFDASNDGQWKQYYTFDEIYEDFDPVDFENAADKQAYLDSRDKTGEFRHVMRKIPFVDLNITFIFPIQDERNYVHRNFFPISGPSDVYAIPSEVEPSKAAPNQNNLSANPLIYDVGYYSVVGAENAEDVPLFVISPRGDIVRIPPFSYIPKRHYIYNREFLTSDKRMKYNGVRNTRDTTVDGGPAVEINFVDPGRLIVSPSDRDPSGPILDVN